LSGWSQFRKRNWRELKFDVGATRQVTRTKTFMTELVIATTNKGKLREIKELLADFDLKITSLADYPNAPVVEEDGKTFAQNALKKAATIALYTKKLTLGEDSGLEVKA